MTTPKYKFDGVWTDNGRYTRAWKEGRGRNSEIIVQIWNGSTPDGEPAGDWAMPGMLGELVAIAQAHAQTPMPAKST